MLVLKFVFLIAILIWMDGLVENRVLLLPNVLASVSHVGLISFFEFGFGIKSQEISQ